MEWLIAFTLKYGSEIALAILVAEKVASATPHDFKIGPIPIGRWDNQIVDGVKWFFSQLVPGKKK